jgi:hypothetical protein
MRHIIAGVVISGQKHGDLKKVSVGAVSDFFNGLVEASIFRSAVLGVTDLEDLRSGMRLFFEGLKV